MSWGTASYREGTVNVVSANAQFGVSLEAMPVELVGGGTVYFTVKASNYLGNAYSVFGYVVDEDGAVIKRVSATLPASVQDYTLTSFSLQVSDVGNHTYKLFLDNADGKPNGVSEEHWNEVRAIVKPVGNVIATMDCNPSIVPLDDSTTCTVHIELKSADTVMLNLKEVDFGGKKIWPNGPSSVTVNKQTVTLTPTNMQEGLTITITINDELANYYFKKEPLGWGSYSDRLVGYSYLVRAVFSDGIVTSDINWNNR
ncbi:hypothetical protein VFC49_08350 [Thermococcus sp. SY098]|uniref:hypothetical protein n=1 Tax=Thermococcus sp. SY098 TaxID=3111325 RepID=UPI002D7843A1|nr:hypothetical protein [Thermococcus sp. SY098]WRS52067.1 hypothetical protein VFC49_08350 [Thermococcus sp. SY098]